MQKHHPQNERIKHKYLAYLKEAKRLSDATVDQVASALADFEASTGHRDFKKFHVEQARKYKRDLGGRLNPKSQKPLAVATQQSRLMVVKAFIQWLADQPGYKSRITYADAEYFNPTHNDSRIAKASRPRPCPTVEQISHVLATMPTETVLERRGRALIAFTLLTGARDSALASLSLKHLDVEARRLVQDAREVKTKNRKTIESYFFPVGDEIEHIVRDWVGELGHEHKFGPDDPLFPKTRIERAGGTDLFQAMGIDRCHWQTAEPIRRIFREAFESAGLPYFNPHSFRSTLATLGERVCQTPEQFKAWSQNLGHEHVLTTFTSYGQVNGDRQGEILGTLGADSITPNGDQIADAIALLQRLQDGV